MITPPFPCVWIGFIGFADDETKPRMMRKSGGVFSKGQSQWRN
jgi:hypothetical protein